MVRIVVLFVVGWVGFWLPGFCRVSSRPLRDFLPVSYGRPAVFQDTSRAYEWLRLARLHMQQEPDKARNLANKALERSERDGNKKGQGDALNILANLETQEGNFEKALELYRKALRIREDLGRKADISATLNNLGNVYSRTGKSSLALTFYLRALKIDEALRDEKAIAMDYANMGSVYFYQKEYDQALRMYEASLDLELKLGQTANRARMYEKIGQVYSQISFAKAEENLLKASQLFEILGDRKGKADVAGHLGLLHYQSGNFSKALDFQKMAFQFFQESGNQLKIKELSNNLGFTYFRLREFEKSRHFLEKSLALSRTMNAFQDISSDYLGLSLVDSATGDFQKALLHRGLASRYRDSIFNLENTRKITEQRLQFDFDKRETALRFQKLLSDQELEKQTLLATKQQQEIRLKEQAIELSQAQKVQAELRTVRVQSQKELREKQLALAHKEKTLQKEEIVRSRTELKFQALVRNGVLAVLLATLVVSFVIWKQRNRIAREKKKSDQLVVEKEMLMREIHHRVKNNLEVISSLLELQSNTMQEGQAKSAVLEGQSRVQSIALIHQKLYRTDEVASVDFTEFVTDLYQQVAAVFRKPGTEVDFSVQAAETRVSIDSAVPLGLIVNELLTNSFKYAVLPEKRGAIQLELRAEAEEGKYTLVYRDNGPGIPEGFDPKKSTSLGMKVIGLLTRQLGGKMKTYNQEGSVFEIPFRA